MAGFLAVLFVAYLVKEEYDVKEIAAYPELLPTRGGVIVGSKELNAGMYELGAFAILEHHEAVDPGSRLGAHFFEVRALRLLEREVCEEVRESELQ